MAEAVKSKRTVDSKVLRKRGAMIMLLVLILGVGGYLAFFRSNQKRIRDLYLSQAKGLVRHDKYGEAAVALQKASLADPDNLQIQTERLKAEIFQITKRYDILSWLMDLESLDQAEADCHRLLRADPDNAEVLALLGIVYAHKDQPALALETYKRASAIAPTYPNVRNYWGRSAWQWQYPDNWLELSTQKFNEAQQLDPTYPSPRMNLAIFQVFSAIAAYKENKADKAEYFEAAIKMLTEIEKLGGNNESLYSAWGYTLAAWGKALLDTNKIEAYKKFSEALEKFRISENINPNLVPVQLNKAETLEYLSVGSERADEAIAGYTKALELQPALVEAHTAIAKLLVKRNSSDRKTLEEAREHYNQAIELTIRTIEQYGIRKARTSDAHALKMLDQWTESRRKEKAGLDDEISKLNSLLADASPSGNGVKNK